MEKSGYEQQLCTTSQCTLCNLRVIGVACSALFHTP